jgi:hypothetical protein
LGSQAAEPTPQNQEEDFPRLLSSIFDGQVVSGGGGEIDSSCDFPPGLPRRDDTPSEVWDNCVRPEGTCSSTSDEHSNHLDDHDSFDG